ncbi:glycine betaine/proline transport system substrate-binding protein [Microbacterium endophyticum]|uniref:Glycine betaine/proline transport system substrate-binding protein n=1 Tax=Microbacterium endophyticum TaxID=1526412 RepID=A0A7W4V5D3_9MICO|nr:glycine betaine ABC transporter substrate-binding protein [Microbacterium endophyticum]MBB2977176.1 glycine betaine/proline transport system substrate-binding protein [Microbacterium endophyticum]NIK36030.1 glycine betaine/proline transport system substrate-binding protein [Microbacterium endophyticum]
MTKRSTLTAGIALTGVAALALTGCAGTSDDASGSSDASGDRAVKIAVFNGWDEGIAASELWKAILEDKGYDVELEYADPAAVYTGISKENYDLTLDTWLPLTHADYMETYGDELVDLGAWNDEAKLTIAVNEDAPIDSLSELAENADLFDNKLVGIEAGSGLVTVTQDEVIPGYGLEDMDFVVSSTPAMLAELQSKTDAGENVAVTLWRPHWAYNAFPLKDLEDPEGLLGDAEGIHTVTSTSFADEFSEVNGWLADFKMPSETLYSLEDAMFSDGGSDDYTDVVQQWISDNQEYVDSLTS